MTGIPQFNYPAFMAAAKIVRALGHEAINPAEVDDEETQAEAMASEDGMLVDGQTAGHTWGDLLARDVKLVADEVDGVVLLPGWENSRGARLEAFVAVSVQKPIYELCYDELEECPPVAVMDVIADMVVDQGDVKRYG